MAGVMSDLLKYCCRCGRERNGEGKCTCKPSLGPRYCAMCGNERKEGDGGNSMACRPCDAIYHRAYRERYPAFIAAQRLNEKAWREKNTDRIRENRRPYIAAVSAAKRAATAKLWEDARARRCFSPAEAAEMIGIARQTLILQHYKGAIKSCGRISNRPIFHANEIERYRRESKGQYGYQNNRRYRDTVARNKTIPVGAVKGTGVIPPPIDDPREGDRIHLGWLVAA